MKKLVETNLSLVGEKDFRAVYTDKVKEGLLDYAYGRKGSSPDVEGDYVFDKFKAAVEEMPEEITVLPKYDIDAYLEKGYKKIFVCSCCGNDENDGTEKSPVATVEKAISLAKSGEKTAICLYAGKYSLLDTLCIEKSLSGSPEFPFIFTSVGNGEVCISTSTLIDFSDFSPIEADDEIAARLPESAKSKVLFADMKKKGWTEAQIGKTTKYTQQEDLGIVEKFRHPRLFVGGKTLDIARYPNASDNRYDLLYFDDVYETGSVIDQNGSRLYAGWTLRVKFYVNYKAYLEGKGEKPDWNIVYKYQGKMIPLYENEAAAMADFEKLAAREKEGYPVFVDSYGKLNMDLGFTIGFTENLQEKADNPTTKEKLAEIANWKSIRDREVMIYGNAYEGWDFDRYIISSIDEKDGAYTLTTAGGSRWGAGRSGNSPTGHNTYHIYNAIEALDTEGEWYMDSVTGRMYIYPTEEMKTAKIEYSANACDIMKIEADNVIVNGIHFDMSNSRGVYAENAEGIVVQDCVITNMNAEAIEFNETSNCAIIYNTFKYNMDFSVNVIGESFIERGIPARNIVQNNYVDEPVDTQRGLNICGYMNCASHNTLIMSNLLISGGGRVSLENVIEYNNIPGGHTAVSDAGLIYMNQFYARGTHVRYNYLHSWNAPGNGVYLDDLNSGNYIYCNVIDTTEAKNLKPKGFIYSSSGHDHMMFNNFCIGRAKIVETVTHPDGSVEKLTKNGVISSSVGEKTADGKYPFTVLVYGKKYTVMTEMQDNQTNRVYSGSTDIGDGESLEVWAMKTQSDTDGDAVSFTLNKKDKSKIHLANYNDRINQSWMYFCDGCWLGYRFYGFADKFIRDYKFAKEGAIYEKRFPELYTYIDMYNEYRANRDKADYRINPMEIFIRSAAMNNARYNIVLGVPKPFEYGNSAKSAHGVDAEGNECEFFSTHTTVYKNNFDCTSEGYDSISDMILEYQEKGKNSSFDFRTLIEKAECEQKKINPEYKSILFVLDKAGIIK